MYHICLVFSKSISVAFAPHEHVSLDKSLIEIKRGFFFPEKKVQKGIRILAEDEAQEVSKYLVRL